MRKQKTIHSFFLKIIFAFILVAVISAAGILPASIPAEAKSSVETWGVFIGGKCLKKNSKKIRSFKNIVVDAQYYSKSEIRSFKKGGRKVYSYFSIGSLENYRPYSKRFRKYIKGNYMYWQDEQWIDVTQKRWQNFIVNELVEGFRKKRVDGVWVDNTDIYYEYQTPQVYKSLVSMIKRIRKKGMPVYINGGDVFVDALIKDKKTNTHIIEGITQEEVLTRISNYGKNQFAVQTKADQIYFMRYCARVRNAGLKVVLLEYAKKNNKKQRKMIVNFCKSNRYKVYISDNVQLE